MQSDVHRNGQKLSCTQQLCEIVLHIRSGVRAAVRCHTLLLKVIMAPLQTVEIMQHNTAYGLPLTVPCNKRHAAVECHERSKPPLPFQAANLLRHATLKLQTVFLLHHVWEPKLMWASPARQLTLRHLSNWQELQAPGGWGTGSPPPQPARMPPQEWSSCGVHSGGPADRMACWNQCTTPSVLRSSFRHHATAPACSTPCCNPLEHLVKAHLIIWLRVRLMSCKLRLFSAMFSAWKTGGDKVQGVQVWIRQVNSMHGTQHSM